MKNKSPRRTFLKSAALATTGISLLKLSSSELLANPLPLDHQRNDVSEDNETMKTIKGLRTIHGNFAEKKIPEETMEKIQKACVRAANASNMQSYSIIVVRDRERMKSICGYQGSHLMVFCADTNRMERCAEKLNHPYYPANMTALVTNTINASLVAQTAVIAARSFGIDGLTTNGIHRGDMSRLWELLDLPEKHCFPILALVLGYPTEEPAAYKGRLDGVGVFHDDKYHKLTEQEIEGLIAEYDDPESKLQLNDRWQKQGHKHYFDWLFTKWLRRSSRPLEQETSIFKFLKKTGFVDMV